MPDFIRNPWPWYVAGPLIGLTVPLLLILGNKSFGISSSLRHVCAACVPANIPFFKYDWKKEIWNLFFVAGILIGGILAAQFLSNPNPVEVNPKLAAEMAGYGITDYSGLIPSEFFSWPQLLTARGLIMIKPPAIKQQEAVLPVMLSWGSVTCNGLRWWPPVVLWLVVLSWPT